MAKLSKLNLEQANQIGSQSAAIDMMKPSLDNLTASLREAWEREHEVKLQERRKMACDEMLRAFQQMDEQRIIVLSHKSVQE